MYLYMSVSFFYPWVNNSKSNFKVFEERNMEQFTNNLLQIITNLTKGIDLQNITTKIKELETKQGIYFLL